MLITAEEAKELAGGSVDEHLEAISKLIREEAIKKKAFVIIRATPYADWMYSTQKKDSIADLVIRELIKVGYKVTLHYEEHQFVDMGLKISWA